MEKYGAQRALNTHIDGTKPIDGIFASSSLNITAGGYTSMEDGVQGKRPDHRCLWIDVKIQDVFGHTMEGRKQYQGRRVKSNDPRVVKKFNELYKKQALRMKLPQGIFKLERNAIYPLSTELRNEAEIIMNLRERCIAYADKKCRKLHFGAAENTPEFKRLQDTVHMYNLLIGKRIDKRKIKTRTIKRKYKRSNIKTPFRQLLTMELTEVKEQARKAYQEYREYWDKHEEKRSNWLSALAQARALEEIKKNEEQRKNKESASKRKRNNKRKQTDDTKINKATSNQIKSMKLAEASRRLWRRVTWAIGKDRLAGITMVEVTKTLENESTIIEEITSHEGITDALIEAHVKKYQQTNTTPPMTAPLAQQLGYIGNTQDCREILQGNYKKQRGTDKYAALLLSHLARPNIDYHNIPTIITKEDYQQGWRRCKERTSAGGTTVHFGHCKAMASDDQLSEMEAALMSIPLKSGYSYNSWKKGIDCVLLKRKESFNVDGLRTIVLFGAEFNYLNKIMARKLMEQAEQLQELANEQYGSRKDHRAIDHVFNKRISFDILRQSKRPGIVAPTDLKGCYDRICHNIASLCMQRLGIQESAAVCMITTLQQLEHVIRCGYGTSEKGYKGDLWATPMQGFFQGHGAGPCVWAVVSSPVLQIMKEKGCGTFFKCCLSGEQIRIVGYAFVDDTDLIQTGKDIKTPLPQVMTEMQKSLDLWEGLIRATGGALRVDKCRYWAIDFHWEENGQWRFKTSNEIPGELKVRHFDDTIQTLQRLDHDAEYETLGVDLTPDDNIYPEFKKRLKKAKIWADKLRTSHLREQETAAALKATILKSLEYPLPAIFFSEEQHKKLMSTILRAALPKSRFNRNKCRRTVYGPGSHGGLEIHNLATTQIIEHMDMFLRHGPSTPYPLLSVQSN